MKRLALLLPAALLLVAVAVSCKDKKDRDGLKIIKLEDKLSSPEKELKASDYFTDIDYIPLETTDSSLIGMNPAFRFYKDKIIVGSSSSRCLVFDRNTGKFIRSIGNIDKGPRGYNTSQGLWVNGETGTIYLPGWNKDYQKYSIDGEYLGNLPIPAAFGEVRKIDYLDANTLLAYNKKFTGNTPDKLSYFDQEGNVIKSFPNHLKLDSIPVTEIGSIAILKSGPMERLYGGYSSSMLMIEGKNPDTRALMIGEPPVFWHHGNNTWFKEPMSDTIYLLTPQGLTPDRIMDLGKYKLEAKDYINKPARKEHTTVDRLYENDRFLIFSMWMEPEEAVGYCGIMDKQTGEIKISKYEKGLVDDVNGFLDLDILMVMPDNNFMTFVESISVRDWFETHADEAGDVNSKILKLKELKEDANPVLIVMKSK